MRTVKHYHFFALLLLLGICSQAHAEGTKQLSPTAADTSLLLVNNGAYASFASVGGPATSRLQFRLGAPGQEQVFFGFSNAFRGVDSIDYPAAAVDYYFRVLSPSGSVVLDWQPIVANAATNLNTHAQCLAGPSAIAGASGYSAVNYEPLSGAPAGDYYVEISSNNDGSNGINLNIPRFDVTVATRDASPVELAGRVFSRNWALGCPPTKDSGTSPYGAFDRPFNGQMYVYSPEGFVSNVNFSGAGFQPYFFNISFNANGPIDYLDPLTNLRSVDSKAETNPAFKMFLQEPPADLYPSGDYGTMIVDSDYPSLYGCATDETYYIEVAVTKAGQVEVLIDEDGNDGQFTPSTADRMLSLDVEPRPGETIPFVRQVPWDGRDGNGVLVANNASISSRVTFSQVPYHLPVYDAEYMLNGFNVTMVRPAPPVGYTFTYQWDDRNVLEDAPTGSQKVELEGCTTGCHTWDNFNYGNANTINTYWFARREAETRSLTRQDPACGCSSSGTLSLGGVVYNDTDGSKTNNTGEAGYNAVEVYLYDDANQNSIIDNGESIVQTTNTDALGAFNFSVSTSGTPGNLDVRTASAAADATDFGPSFGTRYYANFLGFGSYETGGIQYPLTASLFFTGANIPAGAIIESAELRLTGANSPFAAPNNGGASTVRIYAEAGTSPAITSATSLPANRNRTATNVIWEIASAPVDGQAYVAPSLTEVIQEVIKTPGYTQGDNIHLITQGTGAYNTFRQQEAGAATAPQLVISYTLYDLPQTYVIRLNQADLPNGIVATTDTTKAVGLYTPTDYSCFNDFGFGSDRDGDGTVDGVDLDNDNDGIPDAEETGTLAFSPTGDEDGDGILNFEDLDDAVAGFTAANDANGDGVIDGFDTDRDGVPDVYDLDSDNDGIADLLEAGGTDADGDGVVDDLTDDDGDGLANVVDNNDTDGPLGSGVDVTTPGTSVLTDAAATGTPVAPDADGDGLADYNDLDADGDGISDVAEAGGTDADGDGIADSFTDTDGDGLNDLLDGDVGNDGTAENTANALTALDTDGDGVPDTRDLDSDNDGIADVTEAGGTDNDGDGRFDSTTDADGDGLADVVDGDVGNDGTAENSTQTLVLTGADTDADGRPDTYVRLQDTDGDGIADRYDLDADGDGIPDVVEAGGIDADGDGRFDAAADTDGDGFADAVDGDVGNDGTAENSAAALVRTATDTDGDGAPEGFVTEDIDSDGLPGHLDLDTDNDGLADVLEARGIDTDGDGRFDGTADADGDGLNDAVDNDFSASGTLVRTDAGGAVVDARTNQAIDFDGDGIPNYRDRDSDNDGIADLIEAGVSVALDTDQDGRIDVTPGGDADGDGLADAVDGDANDGPTDTGGSATDGTPAAMTKVDTDGDGSSIDEGLAATYTGSDTDSNPDFLDLDSDNDGITDIVEQAGGATTTDAASGTLNGQQELTAGQDYVANGTYAPRDTDGDGVPDYRDVDADNDGIPDNLEAVCTGCAPAGAFSGNDTNLNGVDDAFEGLTTTNTTGGSNVGTSPVEQTSDTDSVVDYLDTDSDGDGAYDYSEGFDVDGDGFATNDLVALAASYEATNSTGVYTTADTDGDGIPNWLDNTVGQGYDETTRPPFLTPGSAFWLDANGNGLADLLDAAAGGSTSNLPDAGGDPEADWRDLGTQAILPVELISFIASAEACQVQVAWEAASEKYFSHYLVQTSKNGYDWKTHSRTEPQAAGLTTTQSYYTASFQANQAEVYVRLAMVDLDGSTEYSEFLVVESDCATKVDLRVFPNPARVGTTVSVVGAGKGTIDILDATGRRVMQQLSVGDGPTTISTSELVPGFYTLVTPQGDARRLVVR